MVRSQVLAGFAEEKSRISYFNALKFEEKGSFEMLMAESHYWSSVKYTCWAKGFKTKSIRETYITRAKFEMDNYYDYVGKFDATMK